MGWSTAHDNDRAKVDLGRRCLWETVATGAEATVRQEDKQPMSDWVPSMATERWKEGSKAVNVYGKGGCGLEERERLSRFQI